MIKRMHIQRISRVAAGTYYVFSSYSPKGVREVEFEFCPRRFEKATGFYMEPGTGTDVLLEIRRLIHDDRKELAVERARKTRLIRAVSARIIEVARKKGVSLEDVQNSVAGELLFLIETAEKTLERKEAYGTKKAHSKPSREVRNKVVV